MQHAPQKLMRSRRDRMIAGVAGGIGHYLAVDPVIVRLVLVALAFSGISLVAYPILWLIMPLEPLPGAAAAQAGPAAYPNPGQPVTDPDDADQEIPIHNVNPASASSPDDQQVRRNRTLGVILVGLGAFLILNNALPALTPFIIPALLVGAGIFLLRRAA